MKNWFGVQKGPVFVVIVRSEKLAWGSKRVAQQGMPFCWTLLDPVVTLVKGRMQSTLSASNLELASF